MDATAFAEPEILAIGNKKIDAFLSNNVELSKYKRVIQLILRNKTHTLSSELEGLLAKTEELGNAPSDIFNMFNNADIRFPKIKDENGDEIEITHGRFMSFMESKDRRVRKDAFTGVYESYGKYGNTLAAMYSANVNKDVFFAKARNFVGSREAALFGSMIPLNVYDNLLETVHDYLPVLHEYINLKKKVLHLPDIHMYDLYTAMADSTFGPIEFEKAKEIAKDALKPMGDEYLSILQKGFDERWIDIYENQGKRSGAYSWGCYGTYPYVMLNYQNRLNDVFTLVHEMGHSIHSYYTRNSQPYRYGDYKIFVAEVASTCNEALLMHYLLKNCTDEHDRIYLLNKYLEQFRTTFFRQAMFAEFEKITHEMVEKGQTLSNDILCEIYHKLNVQYYGEEIVVDKEIDMEWARIPHFYKSFYVYQYSTGYCAAISLSQKILVEGEKAFDKYREFLAGGNSKDPIELLKIAGVDMSRKEPIQEACEKFKDLVNEISRLVE